MSRFALVSVTVALLVFLASPASGRSALQYVGDSVAPVRSSDHRSVLLVGRDDFLRAIDQRGRLYDRRTPPGCRTRELRFSRLLLGCSDKGVERPSVLNIKTGRRQTPPPPTSPSRYGPAVDSFYMAGRFWIAGARTFSNGGTLPLLMHRYTGEQVEYKGDADLDSPTLRITPHRGEPAPCGPFLQRSRRRRAETLVVRDCGHVKLVKPCPTGCFALTDDLVNGAFIDEGRLGQVDLASERVLRTWLLPRIPHQRVILTLTDRSVFASLLVGDSWRNYRGQLSKPGKTIVRSDTRPHQPSPH